MFDALDNAINTLPIETTLHIVKVIIPLLVLFVIGNITLSIVERTAKRHGKNEGATVRPAIRLLRILLVGVLVIIGGFSYARSWTGLGISFGVFAAAAGFALQRPAASVAAWLTILLKRPFRVGDRIVIGSIARGDVIKVTFTHTYLNEVGRYGAEDISGRTVMVPNSVIFDTPITRYGAKNDKILGEVEVTVGYNTDVKAACGVFENVATEIIGASAKPHTRVKLGDSGVKIELRYQVAIGEANKLASDINARILDVVRQQKNIELAYPHMDVRVLK